MRHGFFRVTILALVLGATLFTACGDEDGTDCDVDRSETCTERLNSCLAQCADGPYGECSAGCETTNCNCQVNAACLPAGTDCNFEGI